MDLVAADYYRDIGSDKVLNGRASWDRSGEHGLWPDESGPGGDHTYGVRWTGEADLHWDIRPNQRLTLGGEYTSVPVARYRYEVGDYRTSMSRPYDIKSIFAEYEYRPTPKLGLVVGIRHDDFS